MTTREQRLRELIRQWRTRQVSGNQPLMNSGAKRGLEWCADELEEILNEDVEQAAEPAKRYVVLKASGSRYAYVNDTLEGKTVQRYDVLAGNGWADADRHAQSLNDALKEPGQ